MSPTSCCMHLESISSNSLVWKVLIVFRCPQSSSDFVPVRSPTLPPAHWERFHLQLRHPLPPIILQCSDVGMSWTQLTQCKSPLSLSGRLIWLCSIKKKNGWCTFWWGRISIGWCIQRASIDLNSMVFHGWTPMITYDYMTDITRCVTSIRIGMNWPIQNLIVARVHIIGLAGHGDTLTSFGIFWRVVLAPFSWQCSCHCSCWLFLSGPHPPRTSMRVICSQL